jgi:hypothetical protein
VYVEGPSDQFGLEALWFRWKQALTPKGIGLSIVPLHDKTCFLKFFGQRAAAALAESEDDLVVALPDLYPNKPYADTTWAHGNLQDLRALLTRSVRVALAETQRIRADRVPEFLGRLHVSAMKHDFEMLLLAAVQPMRGFLGADDALGQWRHPVEDQDQDRPPKRIVEELVAKHLKRRYRDTMDAPAVLKRVEEIGAILRNEHGQIECPAFKETLDWLGEKTGVPAYSLAQGRA